MALEVDLILIQKLFTSLIIGLIIGLEREIAQDKADRIKSAGLRTFGIAGLLGGTAAFLAQTEPFVFVGALLCMSILVAAAYYRSTILEPHLGFTTELSLILTFLLGGMAYFQDAVAVILTILVTILLAFKQPLHEFSHKIPKDEFYDSLKFALIAIVILPILPNKTFGPMDFFNPHEIWLVVVLISGISFVGYFLVKWFGPYTGLAMTGVVGGLASSTAVTTTMAARTKELKGMEYSAMVAATLANVIMLIRVSFLVSVFYPILLTRLYLPIGFMFLAGLGVAAYFYMNASKEIASTKSIQIKSPFRILPALKFAAFFVIILLISKLASAYIGSSGLYLTSLIAGLADVDALTISAAQLASQGLAEPFVATTAILLAVFMNLGVRIVYAYYLGTKKFGMYTIGMAAVMVAAGVLVVMLMSYA
ncbi:hypothetical protein CUJ83_04520 [Methanocella sp. CWC-04]|uniref:DUF4010 domain-containing protein n=1 Tax=Methanooceanicella nereidis TaxID=2052831 RepID=A0AAP2RCS4_9EURY|nr:MgtC/SapB family protein [Methanocella sp. CWC-04]MCD1294260.1 hypothetical protein [Methanocella sp. CWC-04]